MKRFRVADITDHLNFEQGLYLLPMSGRGKALLLSFLENVSYPYLWDNWEIAEPILDEVRGEMATDVKPLLERIAVALETIAEQGEDGGAGQIEDELKWIKDIALVLGAADVPEVMP